MNALINYPGMGSVWLTDAVINGDFVEGKVWDDSEAGSPYMPDDYSGQWEWMNFPKSCIRKIDQVITNRQTRMMKRLSGLGFITFNTTNTIGSIGAMREMTAQPF